MQLKTTIHFKQLEESDKRITIHQGGTRSAKTYNILIWYIHKLLQEENKTLTIVRKTMPSVVKTVFKDFVEICNNLNIYEPKCLNKKDWVYTIGNNTVQFVGLDDPQKIRGAKRNYLFINEANELTYEDFFQLNIRTTEKIVLDYNPSDEFHWIYEQIITREDADFYKTTYKDNPFLEKSLVAEIERLKEVDLNYWRVYGLGERGFSKSQIFNTWYQIEDIYNNTGQRSFIYGLDLGYNDPTTLIQTRIHENNIYAKELLYRTMMTTKEIIEECKTLINKRNSPIYIDNSRPEVIEEMRRAGLNAKPSFKGKNSIKDGIDLIKSRKLYITKDSINLNKELKMYKWKEDINHNPTDIPVDVNNHCIDALRYSLSEIRLNKHNTTKAFLGIKI